MPKWIDHIVVRVKDLDATLKDYETKLGMKASKGPEAEPLGDGAIAKSLAKFGEGVHLVALAVDDLKEAAAEMKGNGARVIETQGQVFIHPADGHGVLYQLIERK